MSGAMKCRICGYDKTDCVGSNSCVRFWQESSDDPLEALNAISRLSLYRPTDEELDGEDAKHYRQVLGRWEAAEIARAAIQKATGEGNE